MRLSLTLGVRDLEKSEFFYREILLQQPERFQAAAEFAPMLILRCEETVVVFRQLEDLEQQHPALLQNLSRHPLGVGLQLELACPDLSGVRSRLERWQIRTLYELEDKEHQRREIWLHDPDGYLLVLNEDEQ